MDPGRVNLHRSAAAGVPTAGAPRFPGVDQPGVVTSSFCTDGGCVGVTIEAGQVTVVDTKSDESPALRFTPAEWAAFVAGVKAGEFDSPGAAPGPR
jgi:hypothetical protein